MSEEEGGKEGGRHELVLGDSGDTVEDGTMLQRAWQRSLDLRG